MGKKRKKSFEKQKKKSQSEIITTVLLILLVIVAIVIVWNIVLPMIKNADDSADVGLITTNLEIQSAKLYLTGGADIQVKRLAGEGNISSLKFIFYDKDGNSNIVKEEQITLNELETKTFSISADKIKLDNSKIARVSVVLMLGKNNGAEIKELDSLIKKDSLGNRILDSPNGIVSWFRFDSDFRDSIIGNSLICQNCPTMNVDINGNPKRAVSFDGISQTINSSSIISGSQGSISLWIKTNQPRDIYNTYSASNNQNTLFVNGAMLTLRIGNGGAVTDTQCNANLVLDNKWHLITTTWISGVESTIYVDNKKEASQIGTPAFNPGPVLEIGQKSYFVPVFFEGSMDNIMIFNRALSASEIANIYNNQKA